MGGEDTRHFQQVPRIGSGFRLRSAAVPIVAFLLHPELDAAIAQLGAAARGLKTPVRLSRSPVQNGIAMQAGGLEEGTPACIPSNARPGNGDTQKWSELLGTENGLPAVPVVFRPSICLLCAPRNHFPGSSLVVPTGNAKAGARSPAYRRLAEGGELFWPD
jgi:hypothetical protein